MLASCFVALPRAKEMSTKHRGLTQLEGNGVFDHREYVSEVSANASGEFALEQSLEQAGGVLGFRDLCSRLSVATTDQAFRADFDSRRVVMAET